MLSISFFLTFFSGSVSHAKQISCLQFFAFSLFAKREVRSCNQSLVLFLSEIRCSGLTPPTDAPHPAHLDRFKSSLWPFIYACGPSSSSRSLYFLNDPSLQQQKRKKRLESTSLSVLRGHGILSDMWASFLDCILRKWAVAEPEPKGCLRSSNQVKRSEVLWLHKDALPALPPRQIVPLPSPAKGPSIRREGRASCSTIYGHGPHRSTKFYLPWHKRNEIIEESLCVWALPVLRGS